MNNRVTSFDVAKRAGVSRSIVSAVINNTPGIGVSKEKRKAVLEAIKELNYQVDSHARGMRTGRSRCIAAYDNFGNRFFMQILLGLKEECAAAGYHVLLYGSGEAEDDREGLIDLFLQRRIDGIITKDSTSYNDLNWLEETRTRGIPFISVEGYPENNEVPSVLMDYYESIKLSMDYIQSKNIPSPVYLEMYNGPAYNPNWGDRMRRKGYEDGMAAQGQRPKVFEIEHIPGSNAEAWWIEWLKAQPLPLTVLSNWSIGALHLYRAAYKLGITIGKELFIMAGDNTAEVNEYLVPSLSAVEVPYKEMGKSAARRIIQYIEGHKELTDTSSIYIPPKLVGRESV